MFGGSSQLPTTAESAVIKSLCRVQTTKQCSAVVVSWEDTSNIWLTAAKIEFIGRPFNLRVRMLLSEKRSNYADPILATLLRAPTISVIAQNYLSCFRSVNIRAENIYTRPMFSCHNCIYWYLISACYKTLRMPGS